MEHVDEVEKLLVRNTTGERADDLEKLIAISHVKRVAEEGVTRAKLEEMRERIGKDIRKFRELFGGPGPRLALQPVETAHGHGAKKVQITA